MRPLGSASDVLDISSLSPGDREAFLQLDAAGSFPTPEARVDFLRDAVASSVVQAASTPVDSMGPDWRSLMEAAKRRR
jgi:hypothetical protein